MPKFSPNNNYWEQLQEADIMAYCATAIQFKKPLLLIPIIAYM